MKRKLLFSLLILSLSLGGAWLIWFRPSKAIRLNENFGFFRNVVDLDQEKPEKLGAAWFRPNFGYFTWDSMQEDNKAPIDFSGTDQVVSDAERHNLNLLITLFPYADWDQAENSPQCQVSEHDEMLPRNKGNFVEPGLPFYRCNPVDWPAYEKWLTAVIERYDGDGENDMPGLKYPVLYYEIGNEPDLTLDQESESGMVFYLGSADDYTQLLQKSYSIIKSTSSNVQVLIAGMAGTQADFQNFWNDVFATPKIGQYFDIGNIHSISSPNPKSNSNESKNASDLNVTFYKNLLSNYGIQKKIWVTEAENIQGNDLEKNTRLLKDSVTNALKNGAEKIFFTGASLTNDPTRYTPEIFMEERNYYQDIILNQ